MIGLGDLAILKDEIICTGANKKVQGVGDQAEAFGDQEFSDQTNGELGGKPEVILFVLQLWWEAYESLF